jgi:3-dehydroquinate dehydratase II
MSNLIYILNGPNLNKLGTREPEVYGTQSLEDIKANCKKLGTKLNLEIEFRQSNQEGELVDWVQEAGEKARGLVLNAAAYTHTSVALLDALKMLSIPAVEVHLSNVHQREDFRHKSYISPGVTGIISGFGAASYELALQALATIIKS